MTTSVLSRLIIAVSGFVPLLAFHQGNLTTLIDIIDTSSVVIDVLPSPSTIPTGGKVGKFT